MQFNTKKLFADLAAAQRTSRQNEVWSVEIVRCDRPDVPFILIVFDVFSRLPMVLDLTSGNAADITAKLENACRLSGHPTRIWIDHGFEFRSQELEKWAVQHGIEIEYGATIRKGSIVNPFFEKLRIFLNDKSFSTPNELRQMLVDWRLSLQRS